MTTPHEHQWQQTGVGNGTAFLWADFLCCWCGATISETALGQEPASSSPLGGPAPRAVYS